MKQLFYLILFLAASLSLEAQLEIPLQGNPTLERYYAEREAQMPSGWQESQEFEFRGPARACMLEQADKTYVNAGQTQYIDTNIDTSGLGENGQYNCLNCDGNPIGETAIIDDSLMIVASVDVVGVEYSFTIEYCATEGCREATFIAVGRRRGAHYFPPAVELPSGGRALSDGQASLLPGPLACNKFIDGEDEYEGRDQRFYFTTYTDVDSSFYYDAGRYAGVDSVFLVLCDTFAICDTFHFAFDIQRDTIKLADGAQEAIMDDFSYEGPLTDAALWLDNDTYINQEFSVDPPTVGVATFDGLGPKGQPFGGGLGPADQLTSTYLDLTAISDDLFISFWIQPGGLGERPRPQDELVLEYKDFNGDWDEFAVIPLDSFPVSPGQISPFRFFSFPLPPLYKHSAFQFRLTNYNSRNGINNIWHLDYVRLSSTQDSAPNDIAFTQPPANILNNYSSMPWRHFDGIEEEELSPFIEVKIRNLFSEGINAGSLSSVSIEELATGTELFNVPLLATREEVNFTAGLFRERLYDLRGDSLLFAPTPYNGYLAQMRSGTFDGVQPLRFKTQYILAPGAGNQVNAPGYESVLRNDTVCSITVFDNYFAYDDGTAESALVAQEDDQIAVKFTATVDDTLRAIRMHFPHMISDVSNQEFNLKVWIGLLDGEPEFVMNFLRPVYPDQLADTLQGFTTYPLMDASGNLKPLALPAGDFYLGWEQLTNCNFTDCIPFGLDKNTPEGQFFSYFKQGNSSEWRSFPELGVPVPEGALMVRPVVGSETPVATSTDMAVAEAFQLKVFPNPARDLLHFLPAEGPLDDYRIELFNSIGQRIYLGTMPAQLNVGRFESGLYFLKATHMRTKQWVQRRVVID